MLNAEFWQGKHVFLTHINSYVGVWMAFYLRSKGVRVSGYALTTQQEPLFDLLNVAGFANVSFGQAQDESFIKSVLDFAQADILIHLGQINGAIQDEELSAMHLSSIAETLSLFEALKDTASIRSCVVVSSDKVYRKSYGDPLKETSAVGPESVIGAHKLGVEAVVEAYRQKHFRSIKYNKHKIAIAIARTPSSYGPADFSQSLIGAVAQTILNGSEIRIKNPLSLRPWLFVIDQIEGLLLLAQELYVRGPKLSPVYNIGTLEHETIQDVLSELASHMGPTQAQVTWPPKAASMHGYLDSSLIEQDLGWKPRFELSQGLKLTGESYLAYQKGELLNYLSLIV